MEGGTETRAGMSLTPREIVSSYLDQHYRLVFWPDVADAKGPHEPEWQNKVNTIEAYTEGSRVGMITGVEIAPNKYNLDVDIDWSPGMSIVAAMLPPTPFVFGHTSKRFSHFIYTGDEPCASMRFEDPVDKSCLLELRGTKANGDLGFQTMVPPSVWSKDGVREPLTFVRGYPVTPHHMETKTLKYRVTLGAIGMLCAKRLGRNGFGHEARLAWAGFLLRAGVSVEDLVVMGESMSVSTNNTEVVDVRRSIESTAHGLTDPAKKVKGGPAFAKLFGTSGRAIVNRINEWLGKDQDFVRTAEGRVLAKHQGNIRKAIELIGDELSYNEFADKLLFNGRPLEDPQWMGLYLKIDREYHFQPPLDYFKMVVKDLAWQNSFHPVKQYLDKLVWDGIPRIDTWLIECAGVEDSEYTRAVSSIVLIAAVKRIYHPGCKYDEMVVLESSVQGYSKSMACQALCPDPTWFSDDLNLGLHSQQLIEATLGKWIVEASDLAGKRKAEIDQLKAMLSRQVDGPARMAYAHFAVERPRHFIFIGTTNSSAYLTDPSGNRRFWPLTVRPFDVAWIYDHRDQLWAEARVREGQGASIRLPRELWPAASAVQEKRREVDPWETILRKYVIGVSPGLNGRRRVTTESLWTALGITVDKRDRRSALRISDVMQRLGFRRSRVREIGGDVQVGYVQEERGLELEDNEVEEMERSRVPGEDDM